MKRQQIHPRGLLLVALALALNAPLGATVFTVSNTLDSGPGSLRDAITRANATPGNDVIVFNIGGGGPQSIVPLSPLPPLIDPAGVLIDGLTQPGAASGPAPPASAMLMIEIDGTFAGASDGILILSDNNVVQGLVVNRFQQDGIRIQGGVANPTADNNLLFCNFVGTDLGGAVDLGNGTNPSALRGGIHVCNVPGGQANHNLVESNLSSGNWSEGIWVEGPRQPGDVGFNHITHNYVGTDIGGFVDLGNDHEGIALTEGTHDNDVVDNLVSGNDYDGIGIQGFNNLGFPLPPILTRMNLVAHNIVGLDYNLNPLPNTMHGVAVGEYGPTRWGCAVDNHIFDNIIAYNGGAGVSVVEDFIDFINADGNTIRGNAIWKNGGLGIDLGNNGVTLNDPGDLDSGPNEELNFPVITGIVYGAGASTVTGTLSINGNPMQAVVEVFRAMPDPSGHGEGRWLLGTAYPDAAGNWSFGTNLLAPGDDVTATATDMMGNTSEFCLAFRVPGAPSLSSQYRTISTRVGGSVAFSLSAGARQAGRSYLMIGSMSGVQPGLPLGLVTLPLNWDILSVFVLSAINTPVFSNFFGTLDAQGNGSAQLNLPGPFDPSLSGVSMHFAYILLNPIDFASNPVAVQFVNW